MEASVLFLRTEVRHGLTPILGACHEADWQKPIAKYL
jgi:hypothetical protein